MKYLLFLLLAAVALAQQSAWGQCGGNGWTGATSCVSGYYCSKLNDWYSQCVPGTSTTLSTTTSTTGGSSTSSSTTRTSTSSSATATGSIPKVNGLKFTIDGVTKYFAGSNCYWLAFLTNNADVDTVLDHFQSSGLKILRIWGFNDVTSTPSSGTVWFQSFTGSSPTINTGTDGLQRLDYVVKAAEARGIKLIINFVNNWTDYGGMAAYMKFYGGSSNADWYASSTIQAQYQKYIKAVVSRYSSSPAIFAWELANEPRCNGCDTSVIYNWATTTSQYIKSLDSSHMVAIGDEGFGLTGDGSYPYQYSEGLNFTRNLDIPTVDFATFHLYPSSWGTTNDWGNTWIKTHGAACATKGKPCLFEEYGVTYDHCTIESAWQTTSLATAGLAADLFWDLGDTLNGVQTANDGNTIFYGTSDWTCLVTNHVAAIG